MPSPVALLNVDSGIDTIGLSCDSRVDGNGYPSRRNQDILSLRCQSRSPPSVYDFTNDHPEWVDVIVRQANLAAVAAFDPIPTIVVTRGTQTTTIPNFFQRMWGQKTVTRFDQDQMALVSGYIISGQVGLTSEGSSPSWISYGTLMNGAQTALNLRSSLPQNTSQAKSRTPQQDAAFQQMLAGIRKRIGNTVAHKIGHQFILQYMDCDGPGFQPCPGPSPHNTLYEYWDAQSPRYSNVGSPLHWQASDEEDLRQKSLKK